MGSKDADQLTNSIVPDETVPSVAVLSGYTLFYPVSPQT